MATATPILSPSAENLERIREILRNGELAGVPTETVYGLGGNALQEAPLRRIFEVKGRPLIDPLILHFSAFERAEPYIEGHRGLLQRLADRFWPGPLTLVVPKRSLVPDLATAGLPSVAFRVPSHPTFRALLSELDFPVAAPSANPFGYLSPTRPRHVAETLGGRVPAILDGGECAHGVESTIVDLRDPDTPTVLRHGPVERRALDQVLGRSTADAPSPDTAQNGGHAAPGMLKRHYSPRAELQLFDTRTIRSRMRDLAESAEKDAFVFLERPASENTRSNVYWLSEQGDLQEVARNLYALLYQLDRQGINRIRIETPPPNGLGEAITDRLRRAAAG